MESLRSTRFSSFGKASIGAGTETGTGVIGSAERERDDGAGRREGRAFGVAAHGFGYLGGFNGAGTGRACPRPFDAYSFVDLAAAHGLAGVELPEGYLRGMDAGGLARLRSYGEARRLYFVLAGGVLEPRGTGALIGSATALGARTVRVTASTILCGDRRGVASRWPEYLSEVAERLRSVGERAEEAGVSIAVENHQDLTSEELVRLCASAGSESVGVTLDAVNPLAVAEEPLEFARSLGPLIKHVHLKDYRIFSTPQGYRLVRCPVGSGVLDVPGLFRVLAREAPDATVVVELGALEARHVRFLEEDFWRGYPARPFERVLPVLRTREGRSRPPGEEWRTPWELGADHDALAAYEMGQFEESLAFLRGIDPTVRDRRGRGSQG